MFASSRRSIHALFISILFSFSSAPLAAEQLIIKLSSSLSEVESQAFLSEYDLELLEKIETLNMCTVNASATGLALEQLIIDLESDARIKYVEKNLNTGTSGYIPFDSDIDEQWHHQTINSETAWDLSRGDSSVVVAVLDSGLQFDNPELSGLRFLPGYNFVDDNADAEDDNGHGTRVTGLIAANADNNFTGAGVDHNTSILPVKVLNASNSGATFDLVQGIYYAVEEGADIINMSLGNYPDASSLEEALQAARDAGVILIGSSGNNGIDRADTNFPAASPTTISVGATTNANYRASFSGTGSVVDVVAPGLSVLTTNYSSDPLEPSFDYFSGTSAAAPIVAGVAALAKAIKPDMTQDEFMDAIILTSRDQVGDSTEDTPGRDDFFGWGLIDAEAIVEMIDSAPAVLPALIQAQAFSDSFDTTAADLGDDTCNTGDVDSQITSDNNGVCNIGWTASGEWLEYDVFVGTSGEYNVSLRLASRPGGQVSLEVDGVKAGQVSVDATDWQAFSDYIISTELSEGAHTLRVNFIDGNVNFNYFDAQLVAAAIPARIEAEHFNGFFDSTASDLGDSACDTGAVDSQVTADGDGICNVGWTAAGEWLEYNISVEQADTYYVTLRLASKPGGQVSVDVDGVEVGQVAVNANDWQAYSDYIIPTYLEEGVHTVRVNFIDGNVNFNFLSFDSAEDITLGVDQDSYVRGGYYSIFNYGERTDLVVKGNASPEYTRETYLQFDISGIVDTSIDRAVVRLYANRIDATQDIAVHRIVNHGGDEWDVNWETIPEEGNEIAYTTLSHVEEGQYYEWDVTEYLNEKLDYNSLSVLLKARVDSDEFVYFNAREAGENPPELVITRTSLQ